MTIIKNIFSEAYFIIVYSGAWLIGSENKFSNVLLSILKAVTTWQLVPPLRRVQHSFVSTGFITDSKCSGTTQRKGRKEISSWETRTSVGLGSWLPQPAVLWVISGLLLYIGSSTNLHPNEKYQLHLEMHWSLKRLFWLMCMCSFLQYFGHFDKMSNEQITKTSCKNMSSIDQLYWMKQIIVNLFY